MQLPAARVGPYLRALQAGLLALGPDDGHVPMAEALAQLGALDPALSGPLLAPAELDPLSGMPGFPWMMRARAEQALALEGGAESAMAPEELDRVEGRDPDLARRLLARDALHRFLRASALLPATRLRAALRRENREGVDVVIVYDRLAPDGRWQRIRADLRGSAGYLRAGPFRPGPSGDLEVEPGLQHLLTRHGSTPLLALRESLAQGGRAEVRQLSRGNIGPFWFPGGPAPGGGPLVPPACMRGALVLHLVSEQVGVAVRRSLHRDPLEPPPPEERRPEGQGLFRERRFAVSPAAVDEVKRWAEAAGTPTVVVGMRPGAGPAQAEGTAGGATRRD